MSIVTQMEVSPEFRKWLDELDATAKKWDPTCTDSLSSQTGLECWLDYFEGGYSAEDALREDWSYG